MYKDLLKPIALKKGDTIGIFTPSSPSYIQNEEMFLNGIKNIESLGYKVKLGFLAEDRRSQGYRSACGEERAKEFMSLIHDKEVRLLISTIGGMNSNSMIPFLDFEAIRKSRKIICGYSDVTSLHLSILAFSGLKTIYGPAVMTWFGEYPSGIEESTDSFITAITQTKDVDRTIEPFLQWSNHFRDWSNGDWKNIKRVWQKNLGWKTLNEGKATSEIVVANLNTLISSAGTKYFPELKDKVLLIEEMSAPYSREERSLRQLQLIGVFDQIKGLIFGKTEMPNTEGAPFSLDDLLLEVVGKRSYPIVSEFDCSHTLPMHSLGQRAKITLNAEKKRVKFIIHDSFVS